VSTAAPSGGVGRRHQVALAFLLVPPTWKWLTVANLGSLAVLWFGVWTTDEFSEGEVVRVHRRQRSSGCQPTEVFRDGWTRRT